jgi:DNA polymerase-3 subunit beta
MEARVVKEEVLSGIQKAANIVPTKTGAAFLRTIWLENTDSTLRVMSTDSKLEFSGAYPAETVAEGMVGVQGRNFYDLFRKLPPGEVNLKADPESQSMLLEQGRRKYKLPIYDPSWFQRFADFPEENAVKWSGQFLRTMISRITYCISDDESDPMHCLKINPTQEPGIIEACGLNGHQFAMLRFQQEHVHSLLGDQGVLIAKPYLQELRKWLDTEEIRFAISEKRLFFTNNKQNEIFSLPLNFENFPKYELFFSYFDDETSSMSIDKEELMDSLERILIFNTETQRCVYFVFDNSELVLYGQGQDTGEATETISINFDGRLEKILFPTKNLIEILQHFNSSTLLFTFTSSEGPCKILGEDDEGYIVVIMPVAIQEETYYTEEIMD